jgi:hypothetical protein
VRGDEGGSDDNGSYVSDSAKKCSHADIDSDSENGIDMEEGDDAVAAR